jgi:hypothetical protein
MLLSYDDLKQSPPVCRSAHMVNMSVNTHTLRSEVMLPRLALLVSVESVVAASPMPFSEARVLGLRTIHLS